MKKGLATLMTVVCLTFFAGNIISQAAVNADPGYCGKCKATMIQHGEHVRTYIENHTVTVGGKEETCKITYSVDRTYYTCPNGHGTFIVENSTPIHHSIKH